MSVKSVVGEQKIDTTIIKVNDFTGDSVADTIKVHVFADKFNSPFSWTCELFIGGQCIYHFSVYSDSGTERLLSDSTFVNREMRLHDYATAKRHFFFNDLGVLFLTEKDYNLDGIIEVMTNDSFGPKNYLIDSCSFDDIKSNIIVDSLKVRLKEHRAKPFNFIFDPLSSGAVWMYSKEANRVIPIYHE